MSFRLTSLDVSGLRTLHDVTGIPVQESVTVVCGRNGAGKSSLIEALEILLDDRKMVEGDAFTHGGSEVCVVGEFLDHTAGQLTVRSTATPGRRPVRQLRMDVHSGFGADPAHMSISDLRETFDRLGIPRPGGNAKQPYVEAAEDWISTRPPDETNPAWASLPSEIAAQLPSLTVFRTRQAEGAESHIHQLVEREAQRLLLDHYPDPIEQLTTNLNRDIVPALIRIADFIRTYARMEPQISAVFDFSKPRADVQFHLNDGVSETSASQVGDGNKQRLSLAVHAANLSSMQASSSDRPEIVAYDEPDTHLDYQSQRELFDILGTQGALPQVQVVVATHSTNFIDKVPLGAIVHVRADETDGCVIDVLVNPSDEEEEALLARLAAGVGPRNSSLLGEPCFFVVEGQTEERAIPLLYRSMFTHSMLAHGIAVFNAQGSPALRLIVAALQQWKKTIVCLVDEDSRREPGRVLSEQWLRERGFVEGKDIFFVGQKEFEDAFGDNVWARTLNSHFPKSDGSTWFDGDIAAIRGAVKFSDALRLLIKQGAGWAPGKPRIGEALAAEVCESELPQPVLQVLAQLRTGA